MIFIPTFMIFLTFPFKLVDALIRLIFVSALMPLWVALWVLPVTNGYASKAFQMFLYALVTFIALSVIMTMILIIMDSSFDSLEDASGFWRALKDDKTLDAMEKIDFIGSLSCNEIYMDIFGGWVEKALSKRVLYKILKN